MRLEAASEDDKPHYVQLYSYLSGRNRCGVIGHQSRAIKDMYLLPLSAKSHVHPSLKPFEGAGKFGVRVLLLSINPFL